MGASEHRTVARDGYALVFARASLTRRSIFRVLRGASRGLARWCERRSGNSADGDLSGGVGVRWCYEEGSRDVHVAFFSIRAHARTSMTAGAEAVVARCVSRLVLAPGALIGSFRCLGLFVRYLGLA